MVFSSLPAYLDPSNWQQQQNHNPFHQAAGGINQQQLINITPPSSAQPHVGGVGSPGSIRPGSMAERARLANIPMPEGPLKCPRCDSTNTKFCYFNNYNLTQPRHFCKTCRRYWTRGGALRSVPVGGGCRRNKRSKSTSTNSNKSPPISADRQATSTSTSTVSPLPPLRFTDNYNHSGGVGLNFSGISSPLVGGGTSDEMMNYQIGNSLFGAVEQWRLQQFPFLSGLDAPPQTTAGIYPLGFLGEAGNNNNHQVMRPNNNNKLLLPSSFLSQLGSVKMEDRNNPDAGSGSLSLSRQFLGEQQWNNNNNNNINTAWSDLSSFSSSSTSNLI